MKQEPSGSSLHAPSENETQPAPIPKQAPQMEAGKTESYEVQSALIRLFGMMVRNSPTSFFAFLSKPMEKFSVRWGRAGKAIEPMKILTALCL